MSISETLARALPALAAGLPAFAVGIARLAWGGGHAQETRAAVERTKTVIGELEAQSRGERRDFIPG